MALRIRSSQTFEAETLRCFFLDLLSTLKPEVFLSSSPKENVGYLRQEILRHFVACSILGKPGPPQHTSISTHPRGAKIQDHLRWILLRSCGEEKRWVCTPCCRQTITLFLCKGGNQKEWNYDNDKTGCHWRKNGNPLIDSPGFMNLGKQYHLDIQHSYGSYGSHGS